MVALILQANPDLTPDEKDTFFRSFTFRSEADWLQVVPRKRYIRGDMGMTVDVRYDAGKLQQRLRRLTRPPFPATGAMPSISQTCNMRSISAARSPITITSAPLSGMWAMQY